MIPVQSLINVGNSIGDKTNLTPETFYRDVDSPHLGLKAIFKLPEALVGLPAKVLDLLSSFLQTAIDGREVLIQILFEILIHEFLFPVSATIPQRKADQEAKLGQDCPGLPSFSQRYPRHL